MSLTIDAPETEQRIRELAAQRGVSAEAFLLSLVEAHLQTNGIHSLPFAPKVSVDEQIEALRRLAESFPTNTPPLSDEALRRENLYEDRGL